MRVALSSICLIAAVVVPAFAEVPSPRVFCSDEPAAKSFVENLPETFTAAPLGASDNLFESWLTTLSLKTRLPAEEGGVASEKYVEATTVPRPIPGWDGSPVQFAAVIVVAGDGRPLAVLIIAASDRSFAKAYCANYLDWKFKRTVGRMELRPGIYREVPVVSFLYTRQVFARDPDKSAPTPPAMQVFAKIIN